MASITVRLVAGRNTRASLLSIPQSSPAEPFSAYGLERGGTDEENRPSSVRLSLSAIGLSFGCRGKGAGGGPLPGRVPGWPAVRLGACRPPERSEQAILGKAEQPRIDPPPGGVGVVVGRDGGRIRLEGGRALAQLPFQIRQAGVEPGALAGTQRGAQRAALGHRRHVHRQAEHVRDDLRPQRALGSAAAEGQLGDPGAGEPADDVEMTADDIGGRFLDRADAGRAPGAGRVGHVELEERGAGVHPPARVHDVGQDRDDAVRAGRYPRRRLFHHDVGIDAAAARHGYLAVAERVAVPAHGEPAVEADPLQHPLPRGYVAERPQPDPRDRKSTRLNSSHPSISYAVFCLKKKKNKKVYKNTNSIITKR